MKRIKKLVLINDLENFRTKQHLSRYQLAEKSGCTEHTIQAIEDGIYNPSLLLALTISRVLDVDISLIFGIGVKEVEEPENLIELFRRKNEKNKC